MDSAAEGLLKRAYRCGWYNGRYYRCRSRWNNWGRWVLAAAAIVLFLIFILTLLLTARRRRKRGIKPYYGTAWMAPSTGKYGGGDGYAANNQQSGWNSNNGGYYNNNNGANFNPPPAYDGNAPQNTGTTFGSGQQNGVYGNNQYNSGVQSPPNAYQRDGYYPPPPPPPAGGK